MRPDQSASTITPAAVRQPSSERYTRFLRIAAAGWLGAAVFGQLLFAIYVVAFYGRTAAQGRYTAWNQVMPHGYVPGSEALNAVLAMHLLFAVVMMIGGALQLLPALRRHAPAFHRWNGRLYLLAAAIMAGGGLAMVCLRDTPGDASQHVAISGNALLMLAFAGQAWRCARARRIEEHRRWAMRLFLAASGVWFFRIGLMFWLLLNRGPVGFDPDTFAGPFLTFLAFAQYLLPLAVLELYFRAQRHRDPRRRLAMAVGLGALTLPMLAGIGAAFFAMWLPHL